MRHHIVKFFDAFAAIISRVSTIVAPIGQFISYKLRLKPRHFLTRKNGLRLRYITTSCLVIFMAITSLNIVYSDADNKAMSLSQIDPAAGTSFLYGDEDLHQNKVSNKFDSSFKNLSLASVLSRDIPQPLPLDREVIIQSGDALSKVMEEQGVGNTDAQDIIKAIKPHFDPRHIKVGQKIEMNFEEVDDANQSFREMKIKLDPIKTLVVARADDGFRAEMDEAKVEKKLKAKEAQIETSLSGAAQKAGIPQSVVAEAIRIYSWNVDFQRDIRPKNKIEVLYESFETESGHVAKTGNILYAKLTLNNREIPLYRFTMSDGRTDYFQPDGRSIKRTLMKTPINGARMSSGYGKRRHPVLGYTKMHKGVDFAARTGTPIFAAGDGVIEKAGWFSSYGKYVRIRHNSKLKTAYAHMSKIRPAVKSGSRVKQGDIIGYVGTTGRSTGPHLHYEVLLNGKHVNPRSVNLPTGEELGGSQMTKFKSVMNQTRQKYVSALDGTKVAGFRNIFFN